MQVSLHTMIIILKLVSQWNKFKNDWTKLMCCCNQKTIYQALCNWIINDNQVCWCEKMLLSMLMTCHRNTLLMPKTKMDRNILKSMCNVQKFCRLICMNDLFQNFFNSIAIVNFEMSTIFRTYFMLFWHCIQIK